MPQGPWERREEESDHIQISSCSTSTDAPPAHQERNDLAPAKDPQQHLQGQGQGTGTENADSQSNLLLLHARVPGDAEDSSVCFFPAWLLSPCYCTRHVMEWNGMEDMDMKLRRRQRRYRHGAVAATITSTSTRGYGSGSDIDDIDNDMGLWRWRRRRHHHGAAATTTTSSSRCCSGGDDDDINTINTGLWRCRH
nr:uncharacterized protein LOC109755293 [Aegilops tauschii subsp. strangulata]